MISLVLSIISILVALLSLIWQVLNAWNQRQAKLRIRQSRTFFEGSEDDRTKIKLILRNIGARQTAIYEITLCSAQDATIKGIGYDNRIQLPVIIGAWEIKIIEFRIDKSDEAALSYIKLKDIDDNDLIIPKDCSAWLD